MRGWRFEAWREGGVNVFIRPAPPTDREGGKRRGAGDKTHKENSVFVRNAVHAFLHKGSSLFIDDTQKEVTKAKTDLLARK